MRWPAHLIIGVSVAAVINPIYIPAAALGATAPDWMESLGKLINPHLRHRQETHMLGLWTLAALFAFFVWDWHGFIAAFTLGGVVHCLCDALTVTGIPVSPLSDRRFHLFGGRLRTGDPAEYLIALTVFMVCLVGFNITKADTGFAPFFYHWGEMYQEGLLDASEWKRNRWKVI